MLMGLMIFIFVVVCLLMMVAILLQTSSSEGLGGIAGGMGANNPIFGRGSASLLQKITAGLAVAYMLLALILAKFWASPTVPEIKVKTETQTEATVSEDTGKPDVTTEETTTQETSKPETGGSNTQESGQ